MVCLSRWFADALLAYSASSSGGHSTCFSSFSVFSFTFFAPVLRFIEELGFLWYIILPPKIFVQTKNTNIFERLMSWNMFHISTCVYNFKVPFPLKMGCEYAGAKCKLNHNFSKKYAIWKNGLSNVPMKDITRLY